MLLSFNRSLRAHKRLDNNKRDARHIDYSSQPGCAYSCTWAGEDDSITTTAKVSAELFLAVDGYDWVGFYRVVAPNLLKIGPYQGGHGCLVIPFT